MKAWISAIILSAGLTTLMLVNLFAWQSSTLAVVFGAVYLLCLGLAYGHILFEEQGFFFRWFFGSFFLVALLSAAGAVVYYFYQLDLNVVAVMTGVAAVGFWPFGYRLKSLISAERAMNFLDRRETPERNFNIGSIFFLIAFAVLLYMAFSIVADAGTIESIRSPWDVLAGEFFIVAFFAALSLAAFIFFSRSAWMSVLATVAYASLMLTVAVIVYRLGYGFDGFIHRATEDLIAQLGSVTPKPVYYLGQYSLVILISKIFMVGTEWTDKLLVPVLASIMLPVTVYFAFDRKQEKDKRFAAAMAFSFLALPLGSFIFTTPQNLANLLTLLIVFFGLMYLAFANNGRMIVFLATVAFATLLIHPLSGIPAAIFVFLLVFYSKFRKSKGWLEALRRGIYWQIIVLASIAMPVIFIINSIVSKNLGASINLEAFDMSALSYFLDFRLFHYNYQFKNVYDLVYAYGFNVPLVIAIGAIVGFAILYRKKLFRNYAVYLITFVVLIINFALLKLVVLFPGLIDYERSDYPRRIFELSFYFLIPFLLYFFYHIYKKLWNAGPYLRFALLVFLPLMVTVSFYLTYPRNDDYAANRGYSVGRWDYEANDFIKERAQGDYIVLANQSVSVAALDAYGFKKYYETEDGQDLFYYPIPTGSPLYQHYLSMVNDQPRRATMVQAMDLAHVNEAYFVLNKYWWQADHLVEFAKVTTDEWEIIGNEDVWIFRYEK